MEAQDNVSTYKDVGNNSQEWLRECFARTVLTFWTTEQIRDYLAKMKNDTEREALRRELNRIKFDEKKKT